MNRRNIITVISLLILLISTSYGKKNQFKGERFEVLRDTTQKVLLLNIDSVATEYYDDTKLSPNVEFSDSFLLMRQITYFTLNFVKHIP